MRASRARKRWPQGAATRFVAFQVTMGISCSNTTISSRPPSSVDFIHPSGVKTRGGKRGEGDPAQSHSGLSRCPSTQPFDGEEGSQTARGAGRDARLLQRSVAEAASVAEARLAKIRGSRFRIS